MNLELVDFSSYVSKRGHAWVYAKYPEGRIPMKWQRSHSWTKFWKLPELKYPRESVGPFLTDGLIDDPKYWRLIEASYTALRPFKTHPALFREFAETEFFGEAIRQFANKWGLLGATGKVGHPIIVLFEDGWEELGTESLELYCEPFGGWVRAIATMRHALHLWDMVRDNDKACLSRLIHWSGSDHVFIQDAVNPQLRGRRPKKMTFQDFRGDWTFEIRRVIADERYEVFSEMKPGDVLAPALAYIRQEINMHLVEYTSAQLNASTNITGMGIQIVPNNLFGALWLQFAEAIEDDRDYRRCTQCLKWFEIAPGSGRPDKLYCSDACRMRAYRRRKAAKQ